jgi:hypothetical protein
MLKNLKSFSLTILTCPRDLSLVLETCLLPLLPTFLPTFLPHMYHLLIPSATYAPINYLGSSRTACPGSLTWQVCICISSIIRINGSSPLHAFNQVVFMTSSRMTPIRFKSDLHSFHKSILLPHNSVCLHPVALLLVSASALEIILSRIRTLLTGS